MRCGLVGVAVDASSRDCAAGLAALEEMLPEVNNIHRETIPASELILGTNCGGSDGNSGVTANPALGVASDMLVRYNPEWEGPLLGDKSASVIFDNTKVKRVAGDFECPVDPWIGMRIVAEAYPPSEVFDPAKDALYDRIIAAVLS